MHRKITVAGAVLVGLAFVVVGCAGDPTSMVTQASSASVEQGAPPPPCPNPEGQDCVGQLNAGEEYTTVTFTPALTYAVPVGGWTNLEDTPGNFLLVPPDQSLEGVNANTSDFVGAYTSIVAGQFTGNGACDLEAVPGVDANPEAIVQWLREQSALEVSAPVAASVGGLEGQRVDVRVADGATLPFCTDSESGDEVTVFLLIVGSPPSNLAHGVIPGMTMRLYFLDYNSGVLAVEVTDIDAAPATMDELSAVVDGFTFSP